MRRKPLSQQLAPLEDGGEHRQLTPLQPCKWWGSKKDPVVRKESRDRTYLLEASMDAIPVPDPPDMPLADYECAHGHLPIDQNIKCDCWGPPAEQLPLDLRERIRGLSRPAAIAALLAV